MLTAVVWWLSVPSAAWPLDRWHGAAARERFEQSEKKARNGGVSGVKRKR